MSDNDPKKLDPARARVLDAPERERYLPTDETVVDYGAGTGRITIPVAHLLRDGGHVVAVDSSDEMLGHPRMRVGADPNVAAMHVPADAVPPPDGSADRVLAVNLPHELRGEGAIDEMRRLVADDGFVLVIDWERGRARDLGPPDGLLYDAADATAALANAGLRATPAPVELPFHFARIAASTE